MNRDGALIDSCVNKERATGFRYARIKRTLLSALFLAAAGFSFAIATPAPQDSSSSDAAKYEAQARAVGAPLRFTNPFLLAGTDPRFPNGGDTKKDPKGFDLGDAEQGQNIRRVITAAGGYQPYNFVLAPNLDSPLVGTATLPTLTPIGLLSGPVMAAGSFIRFNVTLTDFIATERTGIFFLRMLNSPAAFRFAVNRLPTAQQGNHYYTTIDTVGGVAPVTYVIVAGSVNSPSTTPLLPAGARLEDAGLSLSPDGILTGRPLVAGTLNFAVQATDATGAVASPRSGSGSGGSQSFKLDIEANTKANSELTTLSCAIKGSQTANSKDTFTYSGLLDMRNETAASLAGSTLTVRIGQTAISGKFDARGRVSAALPPSGKFSATLRSGRLTLKLRGASLAAGLGVSGLAAKTNVNTVIGLELISFRTSDVLNIPTNFRGGNYAMQYRLGGAGLPMTGAFQITALRGADAKTGTPIHFSLPSSRAGQPALPDGDNWDLSFVAAPRMGIEGGKTPGEVIGANTSATVRIGLSFSQQVSLTKRPVLLEFKGTTQTPGIARFRINPKTFINRLQVNTIAQQETAIPPAITTKDLTVFPFGLDLTGFSGDTGRCIAPDRTRWTQR
jgi:hypothetical protein